MALQVLLSVPNGGAIDVPLNSYFKIEFNSPIKEEFYSELNVGNYFQLYTTPAYQKVGVQAGFVEGSPSVIYLLPLQPLIANTKYNLIIIDDVANLADEALANNWVMEFTTGDSNTEDTITITNLLVTFTSVDVPADISDIVTPADINNQIGYESGTGDFYYEQGDDGSISELYVEHSNPINETVGVTSVSNVILYWNEDIQDRYISEIAINKTQLPFETDIFGDHSIPTGGRTITGPKLNIEVYETGYELNIPNTTNYEYTITVPPGVVSKLGDTSIRNGTEIIKFTGPLSPLFSTPDMVKGIISNSTNPEDVTTYDDYNLWKRIHVASKMLVALLETAGQSVPEPEDPNIFWLARYVTCIVAKELLYGPMPGFRYVKSRKVLGQSVTFGNDEFKNVESPLDSCIDSALRYLGISNSVIAPEIGVKSGKSVYYPGRKRSGCYIPDAEIEVERPII